MQLSIERNRQFVMRFSRSGMRILSAPTFSSRENGTSYVSLLSPIEQR